MVLLLIAGVISEVCVSARSIGPIILTRASGVWVQEGNTGGSSTSHFLPSAVFSLAAIKTRLKSFLFKYLKKSKQEDLLIYYLQTRRREKHQIHLFSGFSQELRENLWLQDSFVKLLMQLHSWDEKKPSSCIKKRKFTQFAVNAQKIIKVINRN